MTHSELCRKTAKRFFKDSKVVLFDYQSFATSEFPDVLCFENSHTELYEIKVDRSDFLADQKKACRTKYKNRGYFYHVNGEEKTRWKALAPDLMYIEKPHMGRYRYYVCPDGLISPDELPGGWGLYWYKGGKFYHKKASERFLRNIHEEMAILTHAVRKYASGNGDNIWINTYEVNHAM